MKIVDKFEIKNRGTVAIVTEIGEQKIFLNDFLKQNDQQWQIVGIEMINRRELFPDNPIGLLLKNTNHTFDAPELGYVEHISKQKKPEEQ